MKKSKFFLFVFLIASQSYLIATPSFTSLKEICKIQTTLFYATNLNKLKSHDKIYIDFIENCIAGKDIQAQATSIIKTYHLKLYKKNIDSSCSFVNDSTINNILLSFSHESILNEWNDSKFSFDKSFEKSHSIDRLSTKLYLLFYTKGVLDNEYAYLREKKNEIDLAFNSALKNVLENNYSFDVSLKNMLVKLKDPHVTFLNKNNTYFPKTIKKDSIWIFPFEFIVEENQIYVSTNDPKRTLLLRAIDAYTAKQLIDSVNFYSQSNNIFQFQYSVKQYLSYFFFPEGMHRFVLFDTLLKKEEVMFVGRDAVFAKSHYAAINKEYMPDFLKSKVRVNFSTISDVEFTKIFNSLNDGDTVVIDFRGYPTHHIKSLMKLLPETQKVVATGYFADHSTGCFSRKESYTYNDKNLRGRFNKKITIYGRINFTTGSYVETSVMILKTYLPNFHTIGTPTAGAMGSIELKKLPYGFSFYYPYHKFEFEDKQFVNENSNLIPDLYYYGR